jgi:hypothetical protein
MTELSVSLIESERHRLHHLFERDYPLLGRVILTRQPFHRGVRCKQRANLKWSLRLLNA